MSAVYEFRVVRQQLGISFIGSMLTKPKCPKGARNVRSEEHFFYSVDILQMIALTVYLTFFGHAFFVVFVHGTHPLWCSRKHRRGVFIKSVDRHEIINIYHCPSDGIIHLSRYANKREHIKTPALF